MTKSELKKLIKPIVEQCVNEVLLEGGILSSVISEVVVGLGVQKTLTEQVSTNEARTQATQQDDHQVQRKLQETRSRMMEAIGKDAYAGVDLFEGTAPLKSGGSPGHSPSPTSPMANMDPNDPGVDITRMMPGMDKIWKKLM